MKFLDHPIPSIRTFFTQEWTIGKVLSFLFAIYLIAVIIRVVWLEIR